MSLASALSRGTTSSGLPYKLTLILNGNCPTRCEFCNIWKEPSPDEMTPEEWGSVFRSAPDTVWANLSGGEIFQRTDLPEILDALTASMPRLYLVDFPTTGWWPDRVLDACERLVRGGVRRVLVTVSLDGPVDLHDRMRGRDGAHEHACEAMRVLKKARPARTSAYFGMTLFPENCDRIEETISDACARVPGLTRSDFHFNVGMQSGHYYKNLDYDARPPAGVLEALEHGRRPVRGPVSFLEHAYQKRVASFLETGRSPVPCAAAKASVFVDPRGVVYPCSIYSRPLGELRRTGYDLAVVVRGAEARAAREAVVADQCPGCWTPCEAYQSLFAHYRGR
ncbi:MAG: radical SAM protein [Planctomycetota bacterium]